MNEYMLKLFDDFLVGDGVLEPPLLLVVLEPAVPGDEGSSSSLKEVVHVPSSMSIGPHLVMVQC
jgi:hypothetical protein